MSYFEDQEEAWMDGGCQGDITDMNPDEYWADKLDSGDSDWSEIKKSRGVNNLIKEVQKTLPTNQPTHA